MCKNLVLAGIRCLTVLDPTQLAAEDVAGRFLTQTEGQNVKLVAFRLQFTRLPLMKGASVMYHV